MSDTHSCSEGCDHHHHAILPSGSSLANLSSVIDSEIDLTESMTFETKLIVEYDDPIMTTKGRRVTSGNMAEADICLRKMEQYLAMRESYGVSAQQVGHDLQMFLLATKPKSTLMVNPSIKEIKPSKYTREVVESCPSIPNLSFKTKRCLVIKVTYKDMEGKTREKRFTDLGAIVIHHLYDHIHGKTLHEVGKNPEPTDKPNLVI